MPLSTKDREFLLYRINSTVSRLRHREGNVPFPFTHDELSALPFEDLIQILEALMELARIPPGKI